MREKLKDPDLLLPAGMAMAVLVWAVFRTPPQLPGVQEWWTVYWEHYRACAGYEILLVALCTFVLLRDTWVPLRVGAFALILAILLLGTVEVREFSYGRGLAIAWCKTLAAAGATVFLPLRWINGRYGQVSIARRGSAWVCTRLWRWTLYLVRPRRVSWKLVTGFSVTALLWMVLVSQPGSGTELVPPLFGFQLTTPEWHLFPKTAIAAVAAVVFLVDFRSERFWSQGLLIALGLAVLMNGFVEVHHRLLFAGGTMGVFHPARVQFYTALAAVVVMFSALLYARRRQHDPLRRYVLLLVIYGYLGFMGYHGYNVCRIEAWGPVHLVTGNPVLRGPVDWEWRLYRDMCVGP